MLAPLAVAAGVSIRRRPYVQNVRRNRATVRWTTLEPGEGSVVVSGGDRVERVIAGRSTMRTSIQTLLNFTYYQHEVVINGLSPGADYSYRVRLDGEDLSRDSDLTFRTAGANAFTFLAIGDTGTGSDEQRRLAEQITTERPRLLIHTGDIAYPAGHYEAYENRYFDFYHATMRRVPFYPCLGNHDYLETGARPYLSVHDLPLDNVPERDQGRYYSFDWGDVHFISLDSNDSLYNAVYGTGEMLQWLEKDLAETKKFWRVVFFHHPPYAFGRHIADLQSGLVRSYIVPILERFAVPLVLNGHEHSYQRTHPLNGMVYVTTGGGGASLYPVESSNLLAASASRHHYMRAEVDGWRLTLRAIDIDRREFDTALISPPPVLAPEGAVNSASFTPVVGRGALVTLFGWQFSPETLENGGKPLDARPGAVKVTAGDRELALLMVSPTQVNAILPPELQGPATLRVTTPSGSAEVEIEILPVAPALFSVVSDPLGSPITKASPSAPGATVNLFATGLAGFDGPVTAQIGRERIPARLVATGVPGLQYIALEAPYWLGSGAFPITVEAAGMRSNVVLLWIRS